jgi:hypothetical protein
VKAITQLQEQLAEKDEQLAKKNEILDLLKQRFLQFQEAKRDAAQQIVVGSSMPSNLSLSTSWDSSKSPSTERPVPGSPGRGGWEAAAAKGGSSVRPASPTRGLNTPPTSPSLSTSSGSGSLASGSSGALSSINSGAALTSSGSGAAFNISGQRLHSGSLNCNHHLGTILAMGGLLTLTTP